MISEWRTRWRALFRRNAVETEMDDELLFHIERQTAKYVAAGLPRAESARRARIELGGLERTREECRDARGTRLLESLAQDVRYGLRTLRKNPGYAAVAILSLALGIGANAAIFSLMDTVLLSLLPVRHPEELVVISSLDSDSRPTPSFSYPMYRDLRDRNQVFDGVIARGGVAMNLNYRGITEKVTGELVSGNYYNVLGVQPLAGRLLLPQDDLRAGQHSVAVISYGFWQQRFGSDRSVVGQTLLLNEQPVTVVGIAPPGFYGTNLSANVDVRVPLAMTPVFKPIPYNRMDNRHHQWLDLMARRKSGVSMAQAQASLDVLYHQILAGEEQQLPEGASAFSRKQFMARRIQLLPGGQGQAYLRREMTRPLLLLFGVTGLVLLILCANLANLSLARAAARGPEVAVRLALGAGRARLLRQWLTESVLVSLCGAAASALVATWGRAALVSFVPESSRANLESPLGWRVFLFLLLVGVAAGMLTGLAPALRAARAHPSAALRGDSKGEAQGGGTRSLLNGLIVLQVALSMPLLVGAGLFTRSLRNLEGMDMGFQKENIFLASMNPALNGYSQEKIHGLYTRLLEEVRALPEVRTAGLATGTPLDGGWDELGVVVEGYQPREGEDMNPYSAAISPGYFQSLGIPLVAGRDFTAQDGAGAPQVAIINETMARYFFRGANPLGRKIGLEQVPDTEIVGVVRDSKYTNLREQPLRHMYFPVAQQAQLFDLTLAVRAAANSRATTELVRAAAARVDPHLPLYHLTTLETQVSDSLIQDRLVAWLSGLFGVLATLLSAIGLYGVVSYSTQLRTKEVGVRMALGARPREILRLFLRQTARQLALGVALGSLGALAASGAISSMLFGVRSIEPGIYACAALLLAAAAGLAAYLPARRATRVDPVVALRHE